ncbi:phage capsid protein [uncultured Paraglaciecola sp.]|uniref:phage capsid protein n=1 Tax=uncultured Paraglaciecola sp. TaxID=1765024 RepID=UPI002621E1A3|nr:phage capsid protein [uncultured Paraglaciecola sp.]
MSKNLSAAAQQEFDSLVHHLYQGMGRLRDCCQLRSGVTGDIYKFRTMGKGVANQKPTQADVTPMDIDHTLVNCILENWVAPEYTDIFDQAEVNFDEKSQLAKTISKALGRREDQLLIDALDGAGSYLATVGTATGGSNRMNIGKIRAAGEELDQQEVDEDGRIMILSARSKWSMLEDPELSSSDYNTVKALANGEINTYAGFTFKFIGTRSEGGLTSASNVFDGYAYHKDALGLAIGIDQKTEVNYVPEKTSWLCNGLLKAGAVAIDTTGLVKVQATET